jgi:hypothetical protein
MDNVGKVFSLLLVVILAVSSLIMIESAFAQSIPKPSVPEFTIRFVNASYTMTTTNSYNGQIKTQQISNNSIEVVIKNHPFSYANNSYHVYFNLRVKPHFENTSWWVDAYPLTNYTSSPADANGVYSFAWFVSSGSPNQSSTEQTLITLPLHEVALGYDLGTILMSIPTNGQIDFQVEALVGHNSEEWTRINYSPYFHENETFGFVPAVAYDSTSGWSNTQTINLADGAVSISTSPNPSPTPTVPEFPLISILSLFSAITLTLILMLRKHSKL